MVKTKTRIRAGIEIETIYNSNFGEIERGQYHAGIEKGNFWKVESDGSLYPDNDFIREDDGSFNSQCLEFISETIKSKNGFFNSLNEFKSFFDYKNIPLKTILSFNKSCGCHFHIGMSDNRFYSHKLDFKIIQEFRKYYFKKINESEILNVTTKKLILEHYYRTYSKKTTPSKWVNENRRSMEFNKQSETSGRGLEWRSFNLRGVETWKEFDEVFKIGWECVEFLFSKMVQGWNLKKERIRIPKTKLIDEQKAKIDLTIKERTEEKIYINPIKNKIILNCSLSGDQNV